MNYIIRHRLIFYKGLHYANFNEIIEKEWADSHVKRIRGKCSFAQHEPIIHRALPIKKNI